MNISTVSNTKAIFSLLLVLYSLLSYAQKTDSLKIALKNAKHDTSKISACLSLFDVLYKSNNDSSMIYLEKAQQLIVKSKKTKQSEASRKKIEFQNGMVMNAYGAMFLLRGMRDTAIVLLNKAADSFIKVNNKQELANVYLNLGYALENNAQYDDAIKTYESTLNIYKELKDSVGIGKVLNSIGYTSYNKGDVIMGFNYSIKSMEVWKKLSEAAPKDSVKLESLSGSYNNLGYMYESQGDVSNAIDFFIKSIKISEQLKDVLNVARSLNNIGLLYSKQGDDDKAVEYFTKAIKILSKVKIDSKSGKTLANSYNNIAFVHQNKAISFKTKGNKSASKQETDSAIVIYEKSLQINKSINEKKGIASCFNNLASCYSNLSEILESETEKIKYEELALSTYKQALAIREEMKDKGGIAVVSNNIGGFLLKRKKFKEAEPYCLAGLTLAKEVKKAETIRNAAVNLKDIYKALNKTDKALEMYELYVLMKDSINNDNNLKATKNQQFKYEWEKRESELKAEQDKKDALAKEEKKQQRIVLLAVIAGLLLVIGFSISLYKRFKLTQKQKTIIEKQKQQVDNAYHQLHEKNKEVMDSIHYAARIQRSLITSEKYISSRLKRLMK